MDRDRLRSIPCTRSGTPRTRRQLPLSATIVYAWIHGSHGAHQGTPCIPLDAQPIAYPVTGWNDEGMNRKPAIASIALMLALAGCTGPVTPDEPNEAQPTVVPETETETPAATSVVGITWGDKPDTQFIAGKGPFLEFHSDGTYEGSAGCNGISGDWEQEGHTVTFGPFGVMTGIGCGTTSDWRTLPVTATVTDESITLLNADGAVIDELAAQN